MERLTNKAWRNLDPYECCGQDNYCKRGCFDEGGCNNGCIVPKIYDKLAKYEDAEEQGRLIMLPCKVGCKVFLAEHGKILEEKVLGFIEAGCGLIMNVTYRDYVARPKCESIGKLLDDDHLSVFLSREEAEKALEEKENT